MGPNSTIDGCIGKEMAEHFAEQRLFMYIYVEDRSTY